MRKRLAILAVVLSLGLFGGLFGGVGCHKKSPNNFVSKENGFSINFPKDWELQNDFMGTAVSAMKPATNPESNFRENINIVVADAAGVTSPTAYADGFFDAKKESLTDFQLVERGNTRQGDWKSEWAIFSYSMGTASLKTMVHILLNKGKSYFITCSASPETFDGYRKQFEDVVKTFRFE